MNGEYVHVVWNLVLIKATAGTRRKRNPSEKFHIVWKITLDRVPYKAYSVDMKKATNNGARRGKRDLVRLDLTLTGERAARFFRLRELIVEDGSDRAFALNNFDKLVAGEIARIEVEKKLARGRR